MSIHLIIIGAGLAGLSAAISTKLANSNHKVTILESAKELAEVGAGLQLTPNATRLFKSWGVYNTLLPLATAPAALHVRRYDGTKTLSSTPDFQSQIQERYNAPFWGMHRVDLQHALVSRCKELGVTIKLNSKVANVNFATATVTLESGEQIKGDLVLAADGLWSATRSQFLGHDSPPVHTGDLAYRIVINTADLADPDLRAFVEKKEVNFWIGPETHVVAYTMRGGSVYNIVLLSPDNLPPGVAKLAGDIGEMQRLFEGWDPLLRRFLGEVKKVDKWKLMYHTPLPRWCSEDGRFWMAGDACHPMLPYLAQGANSSLEDGAVVGALLKDVASAEELPRAAKIYEELRKGRGESIQRETFGQRVDFHRGDGLEQRARDEVFKKYEGREVGLDVEGWPSRWQGGTVQKWLYGYDAYEEVEKVLKEKHS
ncbi:FAD/NAD(P)-binding protein [Glarea lozoyensis ATCC 20868]|uniref:FAD/NAD(P)-binding protein n=1 Tax=Glarea lozoyensis (strain ATCC 20868 / MF5171) TaxID=1116229 RepID=S3DND5_GLAL2|nr:FAD/NAD(P)-binding protein [Glarea lozoyensis ATCC 20868]EPE33606.1 FAD/NAD(P)-binding protein [Glarea lozoyensis ATCC 20868]